MVEKDLELGEYEATWTLSGYDTLKARIEVKDTGVMCISVTAGSCNSSTPPGVRVSTFTVTGYLKSAVAPPTEGYLKVDTRPTGASVTVDGVSCGITPVYACTLSVGAKTVTITKSGYNTVTRSVTIVGGQTSDLGIITLTATGAPPTEMTKAEFIAEVQSRGEIDLSKITTTSGWNKWVKKGYAGYWKLAYSDGTKYLLEIWNIHARNPPTRESDIHFSDVRLATPVSISKIETGWALARINALPFVAPPTGVCVELIDDQSDTKTYGANIGRYYTQQLMTRVKRYLSKVVVQRKEGSTGATVTCYIYNSDCSVLIGSASATWADETEFGFDPPLDLNAYATYNICLRRTTGYEDTRWSTADGAYTGKYGASCCGANAYNYKLWLKTYGCEVPSVVPPPPTGFDDWVTSKGGKDAITGGDINELTDAYIGLEDVGFSVTGADVNKATDYYLGLG